MHSHEIRLIWKAGPRAVCSTNVICLEDDGSRWWKIHHRCLRNHDNCAYPNYQSISLHLYLCHISNSGCIFIYISLLYFLELLDPNIGHPFSKVLYISTRLRLNVIVFTMWLQEHWSINVRLLLAFQRLRFVIKCGTTWIYTIQAFTSTVFTVCLNLNTVLFN